MERKLCWSAMLIVVSLILASVLVSAEQEETSRGGAEHVAPVNETTPSNNQTNGSSYHHVWPPMKFGWRIIVGAMVGFLGAACGSVGGVGGGGIFVPMLSLIVGFDTKSSVALSKCMITGAAGSTICYNLNQRHPTLDLPIIDYDLALLFQPMLMLGISIGVMLNVLFADWMVTVLLIILFLGLSTKAFIKGVETWKKETLLKKENTKPAESLNGTRIEVVELSRPANTHPTGPENSAQKKTKVSVLDNVHWKELGLLVLVWIAFLILQITKNYYTTTCSKWYWVLESLQIPVSVGVSLYEAISLYKGKRVIASKGEEKINWKVIQLILYCLLGILAGTIGGLLGMGGGIILGPLFLELGIPPQVSSATATFAMTFSASMSVVEYYLLKRFPVPYALYFVAVATVAAFVGQHAMKKLINILGRASIIIFILASTIFVSAISIGGVGISNMIHRIQRNEYMGFENLCKYQVQHQN